MASCDPAKIDLTLYKKPFILRRTWIKFFCFTGAFIMFLLRYNLSIAIIAILDEPLDNSLINGNFTFNETDDVSRIPIQSNKKYDLSPLMVGQILASYFYGYTFFQLPAGRMSELFGGKLLLASSTLISGILSFLTPFVLDYMNPLGMIVCRIVIGVMHCSVLSCSYTLFAEWLPIREKATAITLCSVGYELGGVTAFYLTGLISTSFGWRYSFYLFSVTAFIWFIPFCFLTSSTPENDSSLSEYERKLIEKERITEYSRDFSNENLIKILPKFNWRIILTSKPVIASCIAKGVIALAYYMVTIKIPHYLSDIFHIHLKTNGTFTAISCIGILSSKTLCLSLSSYLIDLNLMSLTNLRKTFQIIGMIGPALCLFLLTLNIDSLPVCIILIFMCMFTMGFVVLGDSAITAEFAKDLSGSIFGLTNSFSCACGFICPLMCAYILEIYPNDKMYAWNLVFNVSSILLLVGAIFFGFFATAEQQDWSVAEFRNIDEKKKIITIKSSADDSSA